MFNIKTMNKISPKGTKLFDAAKYVCSDSVEAPDAILVRSAKLLDYDFEPTLKCIVRAGAGYNNIPVDRCSEKGIAVFNTPGANANAVKELVIASLILSARQVIPSTDWVKTLKGHGDKVSTEVEAGKSQFEGPEILGKTLGVVGLGAIGSLVANAADALGMRVLGYDPFLSVDAAWNLSSNIQHINDLDTIYAESDYITLHLPSNNETNGMINSETIAKMKDGVRIINIARGELINDADLLAALESGKVNRYVTDFASDALIGGKNVIAFPHIGSSTPESEENCAVMGVRQIKYFLEEGGIRNSVNLPNIEVPRKTGARICMVHKNVPTILGQISSIFSARNINIANLLNKSRGQLAYTIVDLDGDIDDDAKAKLNAIDGILNIRII